VIRPNAKEDVVQASLELLRAEEEIESSMKATVTAKERAKWAKMNLLAATALMRDSSGRKS
jgi:hypothetical protein